ncbi:MAG TPA: hypothetical protein VGI10_19120 [Polyangiaceae bacterium]
MARVQQKSATNKKRAEKPVTAGIHRAARRIGREPRDLKQGAIRDLCYSVGKNLVRASDLLSERIASAQNEQDTELVLALADIHGELWRARWELGLIPESMRIERSALQQLAADVTAAVATQPAGGAS